MYIFEKFKDRVEVCLEVGGDRLLEWRAAALRKSLWVQPPPPHSLLRP